MGVDETLAAYVMSSRLYLMPALLQVKRWLHSNGLPHKGDDDADTDGDEVRTFLGSDMPSAGELYR